MKVIKDPYDRNQIRRRTVALSPYRVYLEQVRAISDNIRASRRGIDYYPLQLGGISGQRKAIIETAVIDILDFQSKGSA